MSKQQNQLKQMKKLTIIWGACLLFMVAILLTIGIVFNKKNKFYMDMENKLENAAQKYVDQSFLYPKEDGKELKVTYTELKESGFIKKIEVNNEECDGYVAVTKKDIAYHYKGYIKCPEYKTKNYQN